MANVYKKGSAELVSKNFKAREFDCKCKNCSDTKIDPLLIAFLQAIRDHFNAPVTLNSGFRCVSHNKAVGGAANSKHLYGSAADITVKGVAPLDVAKYAQSIGVLGIGLYDTFVHIDTRVTKSFWYSSKQLYRATFLENDLVARFKQAAEADGFSFKNKNADFFDSECEAVAKTAILKKRLTYKYKNLTRFIQQLLKIEADGKFGKNTKAAVEKFQIENSLEKDGIVGLNTYKALLGVE